MSNAAGLPVPRRNASSAAADGVCDRCVTVPTMTVSIWSARTPAAASAFSDAAAAMSTTRLVGVGEVAGDDARALADPLVGRVDALADLVVGDHARGAVGADAENAGVLARRCVARALLRLVMPSSSCGCSRTSGLPGGDRVAVFDEPLDDGAPVGAMTVCSSRLVLTWPTLAPGSSSSPTAGVDAVEDPLGRRHQHAPRGGGVERGSASP